MIPRFKECCFQFLLRNVALVRSLKREDISANQCQPSILSNLNRYISSVDGKNYEIIHLDMEKWVCLTQFVRRSFIQDAGSGLTMWDWHCAITPMKWTKMIPLKLSCRKLCKILFEMIEARSAVFIGNKRSKSKKSGWRRYDTHMSRLWESHSCGMCYLEVPQPSFPSFLLFPKIKWKWLIYILRS